MICTQSWIAFFLLRLFFYGLAEWGIRAGADGWIWLLRVSAEYT